MFHSNGITLNSAYQLFLLPNQETGQCLISWYAEVASERLRFIRENQQCMRNTLTNHIEIFDPKHLRAGFLCIQRILLCDMK